jgi:SAM-dependent methyltransferase
MGFEYVGVDVSGSEADLLADAHALPFEDQSFDAILSYAVLEHLQSPFMAIQEISRVLKPGGGFVGTVAQGEPFHASFFHHTAWGLISLFASRPELELVRLWSSGDTLGSLSRMGRYPRAIRCLLAVLHAFHVNAPWLAPRKLFWPARDRQLDRIHCAGSLCFHARKRLLPEAIPEAGQALL